MRDGDIDYSHYMLRELEEALSGIDAARFPQNHANALRAFSAAGGGDPPVREPDIMDEEESAAAEPPWPGPSYDADGRYIPNAIPLASRAKHVAASVLLLAYGGYGVWINDLYLPGKRAGSALHLRDGPAWLMFAAMACAGLVLLSVMVDHYDRRDNERSYRSIARAGEWLGWALFVCAVVWGVIREAP